MSSVVLIGNGITHDNYNIPGIAHARTNSKDNIFMQRRLVQIYIGVGARDLYIDKAHTALDIFSFCGILCLFLTLPSKSHHIFCCVHRVHGIQNS